MAEEVTEGRKFTGKHAAIVFFGGFFVIILVNVILTVYAVGTFPGLDSKNAYVESQAFNRDKAAQEELGWQSDVTYDNGQVILHLQDAQGNVPKPSLVKVRVGRATTDRQDMELDLRFNGSKYVAEYELDKGKWLAFVNIVAADGTPFRQIQEICVESCPSNL